MKLQRVPLQVVWEVDPSPDSESVLRDIFVMLLEQADTDAVDNSI